MPQTWLKKFETYIMLLKHEMFAEDVKTVDKEFIEQIVFWRGQLVERIKQNFPWDKFTFSREVRGNQASSPPHQKANLNKIPSHLRQLQTICCKDRTEGP